MACAAHPDGQGILLAGRLSYTGLQFASHLKVSLAVQGQMLFVCIEICPDKYALTFFLTYSQRSLFLCVFHCGLCIFVIDSLVHLLNLVLC